MSVLTARPGLVAVAWASAIGCRKPSGARPRTSSASASAHPCVANRGIPQALPFRKPRASLADLCAVRQTAHHRLHNLERSRATVTRKRVCGCLALPDFAMGAFDGFQCVVVLGIQVPDGPALAAEHHRLRFRPEVVVNHAMQKLAVGYTCGRESDVVAANQVIDRINPAEVLEPRAPRLLFVIFGAQPEPALKVATKAFQPAGRQDRLRQAGYAEHNVDH